MVDRRLLGGAAVVVTAAMLFTACSGNDGSPQDDAETLDPDRAITLDFAWWGDASRGERYDEALAIFNEQYPNITVRQQFQSWEDYWTARNTEAAAGSLPDVLALVIPTGQTYAGRGQLLDLNTQIGTNLDVSGVPEDLLAAGAQGEGQYVIPIGTNSLSMLYNADLVEQLGVELPAEGYTWDDYNQFVSDLSAAGGAQDPPIYGVGDYTGSFQMFSLWLTQQGVAPYDEDAEVNFTAEHVVQWLEQADEVRTAGAFTPQSTIAQLQAPAFNVGIEATSLSWASGLGPAINDLGTENIALMLPPSGDDGPSLYFGISMGFGASADTDEPEAAALLIDFLANDPEVGRIFGTTRGVPATESQRSGIVAEEGSVDAVVLEYNEMVADAATETPPNEPENFTSLEAEWIRLSEELQYSNITAQEFADTWFTFLDTL